MSTFYLSDISELEKVPRTALPMLVFSTDFRGLFSYLVRVRTRAIYSHFMWLHEPGTFASQQFTFSAVPVEKFAHCKIKIISNPSWNPMQRALLTERIYVELEKPKWKTRYDWINPIGQLFGIKALQNPATRTCSETAQFLTIIEDSYALCNPSPDEVNAWTKTQSAYQTFARYEPD